MKILPLDPEGSASIKFNENMMAPKYGITLPPKIYDNTFGLKSESLIDGTKFEGQFSKP